MLVIIRRRILLFSSLLSKNININIYRTLILPVVMYGCETWSLILREEHRLRVFENRVLRRVFGPKRDEVTGEWWKLHNEELNDLYCSPSIFRVIKSRRWTGHVACNVHNSWNTLYKLHYNPQHVSSSTLLILRRTKLYYYSICYRHSL